MSRACLLQACCEAGVAVSQLCLGMRCRRGRPPQDGRTVLEKLAGALRLLGPGEQVVYRLEREALIELALRLALSRRRSHNPGPALADAPIASCFSLANSLRHIQGVKISATASEISIPMLALIGMGPM